MSGMKTGSRVWIKFNPHDGTEGVVGTVVRMGRGFSWRPQVNVRYTHAGEERTRPFLVEKLDIVTRKSVNARLDVLQGEIDELMRLREEL